jgi:hypothetical protein
MNAGFERSLVAPFAFHHADCDAVHGKAGAAIPTGTLRPGGPAFNSKRHRHPDTSGETTR